MSLKLGNTTIAGVSRHTVSNAHNLLDFKWVDHRLNSMEWLDSTSFSWQSGDVYTSVYNLLVAEYQQGTEETDGNITFKRSPNGYKITTDESGVSALFNSTGIAWYYILDIENRRFKLPRTTHREIIESGDNYRVYSDGYCEQWGIVITNKSTNDFIVTFPKIFKNINYIFNQSQYSTNDDYFQRVTNKLNNSITVKGQNDSTQFDWRACGYLADDQYSKNSLQNYKNLYFYVGEFSQTATEQTAGLNSAMFNNKVDKDDLTEVMLPIESFVSGASGYNIWSNGYCEQWGNFGPAFSSWTAKTITFMKEFKDTDYNVWAMTGHTSNTDSPCINVKTTTSFSCTPYNSTGNACWKACGYLADGEY